MSMNLSIGISEIYLVLYKNTLLKARFFSIKFVYAIQH